MSASGGGRALSICVFCGSAESPPEVFVDTAWQLGEEIGRRGHRLIYGGTPIGLMGVVARAVRANGGPVVGVVPRGLFDDLILDGSTGELVVAHTLAEHKAEMVARADAFVVLPGGYGTLEELVEVLTLRQLGLHTRPVVANQCRRLLAVVSSTHPSHDNPRFRPDWRSPPVPRGRPREPRY